eukprot:gene26479-32003_t
MPGVVINQVFEDKENIAPAKTQPVDKASALTKPGLTKRGKFSQILSEATNQVREQWDEQYAQDTQLDEAVILVEEWVMEQKDYELAKELAAAFEKEAKVDNQMAAIRSEAAAIQAAVEERRRLKADEKARKDQERADEEFAKRLLEEEEKGAQQLYEDDVKLAQQLAEMVTPVKDMKRSDMKEKETPCTPLVDSLAEHKEDAKAESKYEDNDIEADLRRLNQFIKDEAYSRKVAKTEMRAEFQHKKRVAMEACLDLSARDEKSIARLWAAADAAVEDVGGAVALTLLLPNIQKLTVTLKKNGKTLRIEATRLVLDKAAVEPNALNSSFIAEFQLEGGEIRIRPTDVTHVYSSETGFLHVYIEDVNLNFDGKEDKEEKGGILAVGKFFNAMKEGFSRVFAKKK